MKAITISRQMGSLGSEVAEVTARRLGYRMVWREVINEAALRTGAPEMALAVIDELGLLSLKPSEEEHTAYLAVVDQIIQELVHKENVVIIGRAGQIILKDAIGVLHVRIIAPMTVRITRTVDAMNISSDAARKLIEQSDRTRKQYLKRFYQSNIDDPGLYDLVINTERLSIPQTAAVICAALENPS